MKVSIYGFFAAKKKQKLTGLCMRSMGFPRMK